MHWRPRLVIGLGCAALALSACRVLLPDPEGLVEPAAGDPGRRDGRPPDAPRPHDSQCAPVLLTFGATADTTLDSQFPSTNYGSDPKLQVDSAYPVQSLIRFEVAGISGPAARVQVRLNVTNATVDGPEFYATSSSWLESAVTWNTRPPPTGPLLANLGQTNLGDVTVDLGGAVKGNGPFTLLLAPNSDDAVDFQSRETSNGPVLLVTACRPPDAR
ncbi:MAG: DNRLRE domain-containing protein [Deltaproteobacteria bacterium]|nr:DNRLRE domain-containing protein [Deltaproteobacteria bacterium]